MPLCYSRSTSKFNITSKPRMLQARFHETSLGTKDQTPDTEERDGTNMPFGHSQGISENN